MNQNENTIVSADIKQVMTKYKKTITFVFMLLVLISLIVGIV